MLEYHQNTQQHLNMQLVRTMIHSHHSQQPFKGHNTGQVDLQGVPKKWGHQVWKLASSKHLNQFTWFFGKLRHYFTPNTSVVTPYSFNLLENVSLRYLGHIGTWTILLKKSANVLHDGNSRHIQIRKKVSVYLNTVSVPSVANNNQLDNRCISVLPSTLGNI